MLQLENCAKTKCYSSLRWKGGRVLAGRVRLHCVSVEVNAKQVMSVMQGCQEIGMSPVPSRKYLALSCGKGGTVS